MLSVRIHSVDTEHPVFISVASNSNTNRNTNGNPRLSERRGVIHLYRSRHGNGNGNEEQEAPSGVPWLLIVAVPNYFSCDDLLRFFGPRISHVSQFLLIRNDGIEDRYSVLIRTENEASADALYLGFNGKRFSPPEVEICHILYVASSHFTASAHIATTPPPGYIQLPTCPICLERLDHDTCGIQTTLCDHSFHCSCISKWTYLSCQVCRLCQQQDDNKPICSVCNTSENLWICIICGFVGCGRYKEGHMFGHWKDTHHCYSLDLETQRVWDYVGDTYVHRLNQSKADAKSAVVDSHCISHDGNCDTCGDGVDSEITWALFNSKVEGIMDEYNHLLATQLENQRQYYESLLVEAKSRRDNVSVEAEEKASTLKDLQHKLEQYEENKKAILDMNHNLIKDQEEYKKKLEEVEKRELSVIKSRNEQILDREEQIMSRNSGWSSTQMPTKCFCKVTLALKKSWTSDNPGRRFLACKFYDPDTKHRGCEFFKWFDQEQSEWQKEVINEMVIDKKMLGSELKILTASNRHLVDENKMLMEENDMLRLKMKYVVKDNSVVFVESRTNMGGNI